MAKVDQFTLIFTIALIATRIGIYLGGLFYIYYLRQSLPENNIFGFRIHHYFFGIILIIVGWIFKNTILYAIGLALFVDELTFLLIGGKTHEDNYSLISWLGTLGFGILVFIFRYPISQFIQR